MNELKQKSLGCYKWYQIAKDRVIIKTKNFDRYEEYFIRFNELGLDITRKQIKGIYLLIPIFFAFTVLEVYVLIDEYQKGATLSQLLGLLFAVLLFAAFTVYSFFVKTDRVFIQGGLKVFELEGSNPDRQTVDNFIQSLHIAIRRYYKNKYAVIDPILNDEEQIRTYQWPKEIDAVTVDEYAELLHNLKIKNLLG